MKSVYICEKCGKIYTNYEDAMRCENMHSTPMVIDPWTLGDNPEIMPWKYEPRSRYPEMVALKFPRKDDNGEPICGEDGVQLYNVFYFQRVNSAKYDKETARLSELIYAYDVQAQRDHEAWLADYRARQEAKEAAEKNSEDNEE